MRDVFLSWIQWSGKWTQADLLMKKFENQFLYFETWSILRALASTDNVIGNYIRNTLETGWLIKDEVVVAVFNVFLQTVEKWNRLLMDWVLRKMEQTQAICKKMQEAWRDFIVIHFDMPDDIVYERLASRVVCAKCGNNAHWWIVSWRCEICWWELIRRKDDSNVDAVRTRIRSFHQDTQPALDRVEQQWRLVHVDASRWVDEVFDDVLKYVNN